MPHATIPGHCTVAGPFTVEVGQSRAWHVVDQSTISRFDRNWLDRLLLFNRHDADCSVLCDLNGMGHTTSVSRSHGSGHVRLCGTGKR